MALTLEVKNPNLPDGAEVHIDGLGIAINGATTEFSDEDVMNFRQKNAVYKHASGPTGVVTEVKLLRVPTLIKNAQFVKIVKSDDPDNVADPDLSIEGTQDKQEENNA